MTQLRLGVIGYSARALVEAAVDLGYSVQAIDAFADQDTLDVATCHIAGQWPQSLLECARRTQCDGWLLAGGMEHHQRVVADLARQTPVLGPSPTQLRQLRSLRTWRHLAAEVPGLAMPLSFARWSNNGNTPKLYKPHRGSGGMYVSDATATASLNGVPGGYFQQRISGRSIGVTTVLSERSVALGGATESLSAEDWDGPRPYIYRGSIGPIELTDDQRAIIVGMAEFVRDHIGVCGWLQADFIEDDAGRLWLLEINPRWTAGMEVLHACSATRAASPLARHLSAFAWCGALPKPTFAGCKKFGKGVVYAPHKLQLSRQQRIELQSLRNWQSTGNSSGWNIADVPAVGSVEPMLFEAGQPLLTVRFAVSECSGAWRQLRQEILSGLRSAKDEVLDRISSSADRTGAA